MAPTSWLTLLAAFLSESLRSNIPAAPSMPPVQTLRPIQNGTRMLSLGEIAAFEPYSWYAATIACDISDIKTWTCGQKCEKNPTFKPVATGGDGIFTQFWFSGYDPTLDEIIVVHQGTDVSKVFPVLTNLNARQGPLDPELFPNIDPSILVHQGFARTHSRAAPDVINAVKKALHLFYPTEKVTVIGPSLGGAIALLDSVLLPLVLPKNVTVRYVGYGTPRVGNQAFADYVDAQGMSVTRLNNRQDPIPVIPTREFFEYHHPSGEIHAIEDTVWVACSGQDNPDPLCSTGSVTLSTANSSQHNQEFGGVYMGEC